MRGPVGVCQIVTRPNRVEVWACYRGNPALKAELAVDNVDGAGDRYHR